MSIKLLEIFRPYFLIRTKDLSTGRILLDVPMFSTSQGNVKVSPTTALYVCPCEINLGCDVDDVVASDLLPKIDRKRKDEKVNMGRKFKSLFQINCPQSKR